MLGSRSNRTHNLPGRHRGALRPEDCSAEDLRTNSAIGGTLDHHVDINA
jgi:hypothetical protein